MTAPSRFGSTCECCAWVIAWQLLFGKLAFAIEFSADGSLRPAFREESSLLTETCEPPTGKTSSTPLRQTDSASKPVRKFVPALCPAFAHFNNAAANLRETKKLAPVQNSGVDNTRVRPGRGMLGASSRSESTIRQGICVDRRLRRSLHELQNWEK